MTRRSWLRPGRICRKLGGSSEDTSVTRKLVLLQASVAASWARQTFCGFQRTLPWSLSQRLGSITSPCIRFLVVGPGTALRACTGWIFGVGKLMIVRASIYLSVSVSLKFAPEIAWSLKIEGFDGFGAVRHPKTCFSAWPNRTVDVGPPSFVIVCSPTTIWWTQFSWLSVNLGTPSVMIARRVTLEKCPKAHSFEFSCQ